MNAPARAKQHAELHPSDNGRPQLTDRFRQKLEQRGFNLRVLRHFLHGDIAAVAAATGVRLREVGRIAESFCELVANADANVAATGTNEGQAYKRIAAIISVSAHDLMRTAAESGLQLALEDAIVLVKGRVPAARAVADDLNLCFYWMAAQREAGLKADAPLGALQSVMSAATGKIGGAYCTGGHIH